MNAPMVLNTSKVSRLLRAFVCHRSSARSDDVAVAGSHRHVGAADSDLDGLTLAGFAGVLGVVADAVLGAQLLGDALKGRTEAAGCRFGPVHRTTGHTSEFLQVGSTAGVFLGTLPGAAAIDPASAACTGQGSA